MTKNISNSSNITLLASSILADMCTGSFTINLLPSIFTLNGNLNVIGAKIKIVNPYGVKIKDYDVTYDILPPMSSNYVKSIPKIENNFEYGEYVFYVELTDALLNKYEIENVLNLCEPNSKDKSKGYGIISANLIDNCTQGKVSILIDEPPVYKSKMAQSKTQNLTLTYPNATLPVYNFTTSNISVQLFEGLYTLKGDVCAEYNLDNNILVRVPYKIDCEKKINCIVDFCNVYTKLQSLGEDLEECSVEKVKETSNTIFDALRLLKTIELGNKCGKSVSSYIDELEALLGISCVCNNTSGTPVVNIPAPANDISIQGCNTSSALVGLTRVYTINNYEFVVGFDPTISFINISAPVLNGCTKAQTITFNLPQFYLELKELIELDADFYGKLVQQTLVLTPSQLVCFGLTQAQYNLLGYNGFMSILIDKVCNNASTNTCNAVVSLLETENIGSNVKYKWVNNLNVFAVDIYVDDIFLDTVLAPTLEFTNIGAADGKLHKIKIIAKCQTGLNGNNIFTDYSYFGCPQIQEPFLNDTSSDICPFNLTSLVNPAPLGYVYEWHNNQDTLDGSLVPNPLVVNDSGFYYLYIKHISSNCYSVPKMFALKCTTSATCSVPQNCNVESLNVITSLITFSSAAVPPPGNSYTIKRRFTVDADIAANYTTIGTPIYNASSGLWELLDGSIIADRDYMYAFISNCTTGEQRVLINFLSIYCANNYITTNSTTTVIDYNAFSNGGEVDGIDIELWDNSQTVKLFTTTYITPFAVNIIGNFIGLTPNTNYYIRKVVKIGIKAVKCYFKNVVTV